MAKRMTPSQYAAELRRRQQAAKRAVDEYNRQARAYNAALDKAERSYNKAVNDYNRDVKRHNEKVQRQYRERQAATRRAVDEYNRQVRIYNSRVRADRQKMRADAARLLEANHSPQYADYRNSTSQMFSAFERLDSQQPSVTEEHAFLRSLTEHESQRSLDTANLIVGDELPTSEAAPTVEDVSFVQALRDFSEDLALRWEGAVYSLNPANPDAARHFCTSVREIFTTIIDLAAPDAEVLAHKPDCKKAPNGKAPARRSKIEFLIAQKGISDAHLVEFIEADIENVISLFGVFNSATHGAAGKYPMEKLQAIKVRVQEGVLFLFSIAT